MKTKNAVKYMIILSFILSSSFAIAEESGDIYLGVNAGHGIFDNTNIFGEKYMFEYPYFGCNGCNCYGLIYYFNTEDYFVGINLEYILLKSKIWSNTLNVSASYRNIDISPEDAGYLIEELYENKYKQSGVSVIRTKVTHTLFIDMDIIEIDLLYKIKFNTFIQFGINLGPTLTIPFNTDATELYKIRKEGYYTAEDMLVDTIPARDLYNKVNLNQINSNWGLKSNIFIEYEFFNSFKTSAEAGLSLYLLNDQYWNNSSTFVNLKLSYKIR